MNITEITVINRKAVISFEHPKFVTARFNGHCCSWACQGNYKSQSVSVPKEGYTIEKLIAKIEAGFNKLYY